MALRTRRTISEPRTATTIEAIRPFVGPKPIVLGNPAADDAAEDADDDVREATARGPAADERARDGTGDEADDDPADESKVRHGRSIPCATGYGDARNAVTASTTASGWVWWAACFAPGMTTIVPSDEAIVERRGRDAELAPAVAAQDLQHRLLDGAEPFEPGLVARLHGHLARDRRGGSNPPRPDEVGAVTVQVRGAHAHDAGHEGLEERFVLAGGGEDGAARAASAASP